MIKKFITYILVAVVCWGCSDSFEIPQANIIELDGTVELTLEVPGMVISKTRALEDPETAVTDLDVLIYEGEGENSNPKQTIKIHSNSSENTLPNKFEVLEGSGMQIRISFRLATDLRGKQNLRFYFLANVNNEDLSEVTENALKEKKISSSINSSNGGIESMVMCGKASYSEIIGRSAVPLLRNAAKVTVSDKSPLTNDPDLKFFPYELFGVADNSYLLGAIMKKVPSNGNLETPGVSVSDLTSTEATFFNPTHNVPNTEGIGGVLYVVVKASYNDNDYFYRLDFVKKEVAEDGSEQQTYIDAKPNHWYQFIIQEVNAAGYNTPEDAALHPSNGVKYDIHDHSPVSYNMASDGYRELGVSHLIEYTGTANVEGEWSEENLYVKFFSKDEGEVPTAEAVRNLIKIEDPSWLELSDAELVTDFELTGYSYSSDGDKNDEGKIYCLKVRFMQPHMIGSVYNSIIVNWEGLKREVPVVWIRKFNGADVSSASLTMSYNGEDTKIEDYWTFLSSTDDPEGEKNNALWGIQTKANNGKVRNEGFHFPVMYGDDEKFATYSYHLTFDKGEKFAKSNVKSVVVSAPDDAHVSCVKVDGNTENYSYKLTRDNGDTYAYAVGEISFTFTFNDESEELYTFDTYHTGFFHKDSQSHRLDEKDPNNYYYYEVIPVKVGHQTRYMLDRNLAAKSAEMYIRASRDIGAAPAMGDASAAGGYYTVAYQEYASGGTPTYKDPILYDDTNDRVSPPGYVVPNKDIWDAVRLSSSFHAEAVGHYFSDYYVTDNPLIGNVYFPKSMMDIGDNIMGENNAGYYWTSTPSRGTEKDEIGRWLNMLMLTGSSTSYINGRVNNNLNPYGASVRCVNFMPEEAETMLTSFNVSGATHVYLYAVDDGMRTATTSWPGHPIGNFTTMEEGKWFEFSYESTQFDPEELYVIFNFVDEDGIIHTFSQNDNGKTLCTTDVTPAKCNGWKVVGDQNVNIIPSEDFEIDNGITLRPAESTALKNWWRCDVATPFVYDYRMESNATEELKTLYFIGSATPGGWALNEVTAIQQTNSYPEEYTWEGLLINGEFKASFFDPAKIEVNRFWSEPFLRPIIDKTQVSSAGVANPDMGLWKQGANEAFDYKWNVVTPGKYKITFNVTDMKFYAEYSDDLFGSDNPIPENKKRIVVINTQNWNPLYLYYWVDNTNNFDNEWPGTPMANKVPGTENWYYIDIPAEAKFIIYNNGNNVQSADIPLDGDGKLYIFNNGQK